MPTPEGALPPDLLARATLRGNEYAWPVAAIPEVIEQAKGHNLVSVGGQLQFRFPDGATCECYWIEVDTFKTVSPDQPWHERVDQTAAAALSSFQSLRSEHDFLAEGRKGFEAAFAEYEAKGHDPESAMCFVWYIEAEGAKSDAEAWC
jgi:FAD/FMN-containing dehydrogenase